MSQSSAGASVITLRFGLDIGIDIAEQEVQAAINAAGNLLPVGSAGAADLRQGQSGRRADPHARRDLEDDEADRHRGRGREPAGAETVAASRASGWSRSPAASGPRCASTPIRWRSRPTRSISTICARPSPISTSTRPRAVSTGRRNPTRSTPTTRSAIPTIISTPSSPIATARR